MRRFENGSSETKATFLNACGVSSQLPTIEMDDAQEAKSERPPPIPNKHKKQLTASQMAVVVTDTTGSDLVIGPPGRVVTEMLCDLLYPDEEAGVVRVRNLIKRYFQDLFSLVALPGERKLHNMDVVASGMQYHDVMTGLVSGLAASGRSEHSQGWESIQAGGGVSQFFAATKTERVRGTGLYLKAAFATWRLAVGSCLA